VYLYRGYVPECVSVVAGSNLSEVLASPYGRAVLGMFCWAEARSRQPETAAVLPIGGVQGTTLSGIRRRIVRVSDSPVCTV
jgi:hypothetical protein